MLLPDQPEGIKRDILNPYEAMRQLFRFASLPQLKATLWRLLKETLTGPSAPELAPKEQYDLLTFCEKLEKVLEGLELDSQQVWSGTCVMQLSEVYPSGRGLFLWYSHRNIKSFYKQKKPVR